MILRDTPYSPPRHPQHLDCADARVPPAQPLDRGGNAGGHPGRELPFLDRVDVEFERDDCAGRFELKADHWPVLSFVATTRNDDRAAIECRDILFNLTWAHLTDVHRAILGERPARACSESCVHSFSC